jgi:hypothetical protein
MDSTAIPWIILASVVVAAFSAIAAAISAYFSSRSSRTAADAAATTLILKFRDQYATDAMLIDLRNLRAWHDRHGSSKFAKTWQEKFEQKDVVCRSNLPSRTLRNALVAHHVSDRHLAECNYVSGKVGVRGNHATDHLYRLWCAADRLLDVRDGDRSLRLRLSNSFSWAVTMPSTMR